MPVVLPSRDGRIEVQGQQPMQNVGETISRNTLGMVVHVCNANYVEGLR
jgi:hypothetical protein